MGEELRQKELQIDLQEADQVRNSTSKQLSKIESFAIERSVALVVQARTGSERLPGKVLLPILNQIPLLRYLLRRLYSTKGVNRFILATTTKAKDDILVEIAKQEGFEVVRGDEENVLSRYCDAIRQFSIGTVIRITADCPLIDPQLLERGIALYQHYALDYLSNTLQRTFPRGLDFEIVKASALLRVEKELQGRELPLEEGCAQEEREHVTLGIIRRRGQLSFGNVYQMTSYADWRLTVDELPDYLLVREVIETLEGESQEWHLPELYDLLDRKYYWRAINSYVNQKLK